MARGSFKKLELLSVCKVFELGQGVENMYHPACNEVSTMNVCIFRKYNKNHVSVDDLVHIIAVII